MPDNTITMLIGTKKLSGWKSVSVERSLDALADVFSMEFVDIWANSDSPLVPYEPLKVSIFKTSGGKQITEQVVAGYIDTIDMEIIVDQIMVRVSGRSFTGDLVDCSAEFGKSNSWNNTPLTTIIRDLLDLYDIGLDFISSSAYGKDSNLSLTINSGESIFEIIDRECRKRGIIAVTNPYGNLELITTGDRVSQDKLVVGENILSANMTIDYTNRFGVYTVKGQKTGNGSSWNSSTTKINGSATDPVFQGRYRNKIISMDGTGTNQDAQNVASWESQVRAGKSGQLVIKIPSWFQSDGTLWEVGTLVYCNVNPLNVNEQLLINNIKFTQGNDGTFTTLTLVNKDTYSQDPSKTNKITKKSKKKGFGYGW